MKILWTYKWIVDKEYTSWKFSATISLPSSVQHKLLINLDCINVSVGSTLDIFKRCDSVSRLSSWKTTILYVSSMTNNLRRSITNMLHNQSNYLDIFHAHPNSKRLLKKSWIHWTRWDCAISGKVPHRRSRRKAIGNGVCEKFQLHFLIVIGYIHRGSFHAVTVDAGLCWIVWSLWWWRQILTGVDFPARILWLHSWGVLSHKITHHNTFVTIIP